MEIGRGASVAAETAYEDCKRGRDQSTLQSGYC